MLATSRHARALPSLMQSAKPVLSYLILEDGFDYRIQPDSRVSTTLPYLLQLNTLHADFRIYI
jgi:hypothetical protein